METSTVSPFETVLPLLVKTYDIDFAGMVSNIVYIRWLEDLRFAMMADHFPLEIQRARGIAPVLAHTEIDYHLPLRLTDRTEGRMWISALGKLRWAVEAEIRAGDALAAHARQAGYFIKLDSGKPVRMPREVQIAYAAHFA